MDRTETRSNNHQQLRDLIELNDELENYFRNTIIPQLFVDANLILRKFTPPAMKQFSLSTEHIGRPLEEIVDHIRYSTIIDNIQHVIETEEIFEKEIQTTDMRWFQMNIIPYLVKKENRTNGVIITFVDITDRMKVLRDLEKLNASHETFIYSVSHDLKAPLANIEGLVGLLLKSSDELSARCEADNKEQQFIATLLDKAVHSMRSIINELADIAKIEGNFKEIIEKARFEDVLKQVELTIKDKLVESGASITYDLAATEINFSLKNLRSILYNLLSNAVKYRVPGKAPVIHVSTGHDRDFVYLAVKDNGLGIAKEKQDLIFTPYTRIQSDVEGSGIGLYLVKKIVENEGGRIKVASNIGEGTTFTVYLRQKALPPTTPSAD
jgi:two-component system, OmpR family, phosphate regulon sensor histidine kinase PhoR